jgi:hypothetical protein
MLTYIRAGLILAVLGLSAWGGWTARAWLEDSHELDQAKQERDDAIKRERAAETKASEANDARLAAEKALQAKEAQTVERVKIVKQTVIKHVKANPDCDIPDPVASELQRLRAGGE